MIQVFGDINDRERGVVWEEVIIFFSIISNIFLVHIVIHYEWQQNSTPFLALSMFFGSI